MSTAKDYTEEYGTTVQHFTVSVPCLNGDALDITAVDIEYALREHFRPDTVVTVAEDTTDLKTVLANRITIAAKAIEIARKSEPYTAEQYRAVGDTITDGLARIDEAERHWEAAYGEIPSILDVHRAKTLTSY